MKIKIAEHALDGLEKDMGNDELQEFLDEIEKKMEDGSFFEDSKPVDMDRMEEEEPELYEQLMQAINENDIKLN